MSRKPISKKYNLNIHELDDDDIDHGNEDFERPYDLTPVSVSDVATSASAAAPASSFTFTGSKTAEAEGRDKSRQKFAVKSVRRHHSVKHTNTGAAAAGSGVDAAYRHSNNNNTTMSNSSKKFTNRGKDESGIFLSSSTHFMSSHGGQAGSFDGSIDNYEDEDADLDDDNDEDNDDDDVRDNQEDDIDADGDGYEGQDEDDLDGEDEQRQLSPPTPKSPLRRIGGGFTFLKPSDIHPRMEGREDEIQHLRLLAGKLNADWGAQDFMAPALARRIRDFQFAQEKRRKKYGDEKPFGILGLYDHLASIRVDVEWAEDAAWRRANGEP
jgi:hypothetical protein